jgi:hypothetical protein
MKTYWESGNITPPFSTSNVDGHLHAPGLYSWRKSLWYSLDRRLGGAQSRSGRRGKQKNLLPLPVVEPRPSSPVSHRYIDRDIMVHGCMIDELERIWKESVVA